MRPSKDQANSGQLGEGSETPIMYGYSFLARWVLSLAHSTVRAIFFKNVFCRYVFNQINYVRWQNVQMVDTIFSEFSELAAAITVPIQHANHPTVRISAGSADNGTVRARAWYV